MSNNTKSGCSGNTYTTAQMNHHANQNNPNNSAYRSAANNHANQCNPNHKSQITLDHKEEHLSEKIRFETGVLLLICNANKRSFIYEHIC